MTLGDYDYGMLGTTPYPKMAKVVFVLFQEWAHDSAISKFVCDLILLYREPNYNKKYTILYLISASLWEVVSYLY